MVPATMLLVLARPLQRFADHHRQTHAFLMDQAAATLQRDGFRTEARWVQAHRRPLLAGAYWADEGWRNSTHFFDPDTDQGLPLRPHALEVATRYWAAAHGCRAQRQWERAAFFLGAAAHLVQDLCVPHHAAVRLFDGHTAFEDFAEAHRLRHRTEGRGIYHLGEDITAWLVANARFSKPYLPLVTDPHRYPGMTGQALGDLLPRAQRTTAGLLAAFLAVRRHEEVGGSWPPWNTQWPAAI